MALVYADFVAETTTTTGTGTLSLGGAMTGMRTFISAIGNGNTCEYSIKASDGSRESGIGTIASGTPNTLARTTFLSSTTGSKIDLPAGTHEVYCVGTASSYGLIPEASSKASTALQPSAIGVSVQPYSANLADLAGYTHSSFEASGAIATHSALTTTHGISAFGASLVDDADAATARATLGITTGSADNALLRSDGMGGATLQDSGLILGDDGTLQFVGTATAPNAAGAGAIDLVTSRNSAANCASGGNAFAAGYRTSAAGTAAVAFGSGVSAAQSYSLGVGIGNAVSLRGQVVFGIGNSAGAQGNLVTGYHATTDATATVLSLGNNSTYRFTIAAKRLVAFTGIVSAFSDSADGYKCKAWEIKGIITRDGSNSTRIIGTPTITVLGNDTEAASWAVSSITADDTNEALNINVTGEAATNITWQLTLMFSQVGY